MAADVVWLHQIREGGTLQYRMGRRGQSLVAEWPGFAQLTCDQDGGRLHMTPAKGASPRALARLDAVVKALITDLRGGLGLHASAVALGSKAILFLGESGDGKSTAAATLCLRHGARLLADDAALLEERYGVVRVTPSEDRNYLTSGSMGALGVRQRGARLGDGEKAAVHPPRSASRRYPLALVVSLRFDDSLADVVSRPLAGADAARRILAAMFRFDVLDRPRELDRVMRLYEQAPFIEVARPHARPDVISHVIRALGGNHG